MSDEQSNIVSINLQTVGNVNGISQINTTEAAFAHGKIAIVNPNVAPLISFNLNEIYQLNKFYDSATSQGVSFDTIIFEHELKLDACEPLILSFSPDTVAGGIGQVMRIRGECFGEFQSGLSKVEFQNAVDGLVIGDWVDPINGEYRNFGCSSGTIECWSDTLIEVKIPSVGVTGLDTISGEKYAGSNIFRVCNKDTLCGLPLFGDELFVKYSVVNRWTTSTETPASISLEATLKDINGLGGMSLTYDTSFSNNTPAVDAFERALKTWKCATGVNFNQDQTTSNTSGDVISIKFGTLPAGSTSSLAITTQGLQRCKENGTGDFIKANLPLFRMVFRNNVMWHFQEDVSSLDTTKYDFQTIALHELGHAHLLNHVNQEDDLMFHSIDEGETKRVLNQFNKDAGIYIVDISGIPYPNSNCGDPMMPIDTMGLDCFLSNATPDINNEVGKLYLVPNPFSEKLTFQFESNNNGNGNIIIFDIFGRVVFEENIKKVNHEFRKTIQLPDLPKGMYIFSIGIEGNQIISKQIIKS